MIGLSRGHTIDQGNTRTIRSPLTDTLEIALKEIRATDLETLLHNFGGELVHAVLGCVSKNVVDGTASVSW